MKYKPEPDQMLLDDSWDGLPVIQQQEEFSVEEVPDEANETLPVEDFQADHLSPINGEPADPSPPDTSLKLFQAEETTEAPPVEDLQPIAPPSEQVEEPASIALAEPTTSETNDAVTEALLNPPEVPQAETPPSVLKLKITQVEAMKQALSDLGLTAKNAALAEYLQDKFGLLPRNIAVLKSTVKNTYFSKPEPTYPDLPEPEQAVVTECHQELVAPESNGVFQPAEPVLAEPEVVLPPEAILPEPSVPQVESTEEPPIGQGCEVSSELEVELTEEHSVVLDVMEQEPKPMTDLEPITYSMDDVKKVKGLCDRMGVETLLTLIDVLE